MTDTQTLAGPVVTMCQNPDCKGWDMCPDMRRKDKRSMGIADHYDPGLDEAIILRMFRQELALIGASDSTGVMHMVPDGCEFTVHKGWGAIPTEKRTEATECYTAVYSGPDMDLDDILAESPEWDHDAAMARTLAVTAEYGTA